MLRAHDLLKLSAPLLATGLFAACSQAPAASVDAEAAPATSAAPSAPSSKGALEFERIEHDFGQVSDLEELETTFAFTNTGDSEAHIQGVKASCGCTTPSLEKDRFAPGEGDSLAVHWKPKGHGVQTQTVTVRSAELAGGFAQLTIRGEVVPFVRATPAQVQFENVRMHEPHRASTTLTCLDPKWSIEQVKSSSGSFEAALVEERPGGEKVVEVMLLDSARWGPNFGRISVTAVGRLDPQDPNSETVRKVQDISVHAFVYAEVVADKSIVSIGKIAPGAPIRGELVLSRPSGEPFEVLQAVVEGSQPPGIEIEIEPLLQAGKHSKRLVLKGETGSYQGYIKGHVVFTTDIPGEETRRIQIAGNVSSS